MADRLTDSDLDAMDEVIAAYHAQGQAWGSERLADVKALIDEVRERRAAIPPAPGSAPGAPATMESAPNCPTCGRDAERRSDQVCGSIEDCIRCAACGFDYVCVGGRWFEAAPVPPSSTPAPSPGGPIDRATAAISGALIDAETVPVPSMAAIDAWLRAGAPMVSAPSPGGVAVRGTVFTNTNESECGLSVGIGGNDFGGEFYIDLPGAKYGDAVEIVVRPVAGGNKGGSK